METEKVKENLNSIGDKLYAFGESHMGVVLFLGGVVTGWVSGAFLPLPLVFIPGVLLAIAAGLAVWAKRT